MAVGVAVAAVEEAVELRVLADRRVPSSTVRPLSYVIAPSASAAQHVDLARAALGVFVVAIHPEQAREMARLESDRGHHDFQSLCSTN